MKIKQLLLVAAALVVAVACNETPEPKPEPTPEVELSVEPTLVEFLAEGGEQIVALTANAAWTAEPSAEWIALDVTSGTEGLDVKVTVAENEAEEAREGKVVFAAGDKNAELVVKQAAAPLASAVYNDYEAISAIANFWTNEQESDVLIEGAQFKVKVNLNSAVIEIGREYALYNPDSSDADVYISRVSIAKTDDTLIANSACFTRAKFRISDENGVYGTHFSGAGVAPDGETFSVKMSFNGLPEGMSAADSE